MNNIEAIIFLLLLFMGVPDLCRKLGRPALGFPVFVVIGLVLAPFINTGVRGMLSEAGQVGFVLLLFVVGLEIDLPRPRELLQPLRLAGKLAVMQYPLILGIAQVAGLSLVESMVAAAALTGCSVGMAHAAWKSYPLADNAEKTQILQVMVLLELLAIILLSVETVVLEKGFNWVVPLKLLGIAVTVLVLGRTAPHMTRLFQIILQKTTHWRMHFLVLLVLAVCAVGERLGLSAAKTAFVLGLFLSHIEHDGQGLEEYMAPISHRFLIPVFFVALGLQLEWRMFQTWNALLALGTAGLLLGFRELLHRRWINTGGDGKVFLLLTPNLTVVALAANALLQHHAAPGVTAWLVMTGLFMTVGALFLLPVDNGFGKTSHASQI